MSGSSGRVVSPTAAFHALDTEDIVACHNIALSKGLMESVSAYRRKRPEMAGVRTKYEALNENREKEAAFERIRAACYPDCPSRLGALFLFPNRETAKSANISWWNQKRAILAATIVEAYRIGIFDCGLLVAEQDEWDTAAHRYWSGQPSAIPMQEIVLDGTIQLHDYEPYAKLITGIRQ